jgi:hypothetical protein
MAEPDYPPSFRLSSRTPNPVWRQVYQDTTQLFGQYQTFAQRMDGDVGALVKGLVKEGSFLVSISLTSEGRHPFIIQGTIQMQPKKRVQESLADISKSRYRFCTEVSACQLP